MKRAAIWLILAFWAGSAQALSFRDCLKMEQDNAPLAAQRDCYKNLASPAANVPKAAENPAEHQDAKPAAPISEKTAKPSPEKSMLLSTWDPDQSGAISMYRQNYFLPIANSSNPNNAPTSPNPNNRVPYSYPLDNTEAKFQFSFKSRVWAQESSDWAMWFGYTQQSFWQFWDASHSRPFRESNYQPELILSKRFLDPATSAFAPKLLNIAIDHQSNGQSDPRSRSWNRLYVQTGFENDDFQGGTLVLLPRLWTRIQVSNPSQNDNPDITHYLGYGDVQLLYFNHYELSATARIRSLQLDYSYPLEEILRYFSPDWRSDFDLHLQYFTGYGESLIDYNHRQNVWGVGVSLPVWK